MENKTTRSKNKLAVLCLLLCMASPLLSQQLAYWNPAGQTNYGVSPWLPTTSDPNLTVGGMTRGAGVGLTGTPAGNAWGGVNWAGAANQDVTFSVTANVGTVSYSTFNLSYRRSNTGPSLGTFEYAFGNSTTYTVISNINNFTGTVTTGILITPVNLSAVNDLQNVPAGTVVKFRIFPTAGSSVGTWYISGINGASITGTVNTGPVYYATIAPTASVQCNGQSNGELVATVNGTTSPFTYSWMPAGGTGSVATGLAAGVYTCIVTDVNSATTAATYTLTQPSVLTSGIITQTNVSCFGGANGSSTVSPAGGTVPYTYSWSPVGGTTHIATGLSAGIYTVFVSDSHSCTSSQTVAVTEPGPSLTFVSTNSAVCNGQTVMVLASGATTYTFSNGIVNGMPFLPLATALYTVNSTNTVTGCSEVGSFSIVVNSNPTITAASNYSNATACSGDSFILSGAGASTYSWSNGITDSTPFVPAGSSDYTVTGTDANNCTGTATLSITVNPNPTVTASSNFTNSTACSGTSFILHGAGASTYGWSNSVVDGVAFTPAVTSVYSVTGTNTNNCTGTATISIVIHSNPTVTAVSSRTDICKGQTATLTANGAITYSWSSSQGMITNTASAIAISPSVTASYSLSGWDVNGCANTFTLSQKVSSCLGIEELNAGTQVSILVFPNPNAGDFTIKSASDASLLISNELGQTLQTLQLNDSNNRELKISSLSSGIYFIRGTVDNAAVTQKIIVTR